MFYFAWVGGEIIAPFTLTTVGDVWGGSVSLLGSTWNGRLEATGDIFSNGAWVEGGTSIENLLPTDGLVAGRDYSILGNGINTSFSFNGSDGGGIGRSPIAENVSVQIVSGIDNNGFSQYSDIVVLNPRQENLGSLISGRTYSISGSGIPANTFFVYEGSLEIRISNPATTTGKNVAFSISDQSGINVISNIADRSGLVVGQTYRVFGRGISPSTIGTYQEDGTLLLSQPATTTTLQTTIRIHNGTTYPDGGPFSESAHARFDERVLSIGIQHTEGEFPTLDIDLKNPDVGLLSSGRNVWCWLSWRETSGSDIVPLFHGRLVAIPADLTGEVVKLQFIARPSDYENQQALISDTLREAPYYDPVWLTDGIDNPSTILEARTSLWHIDRVTLETSISDITIGEDGTLSISEADHVFSSTKVKYGNPPLAAVYVSANVTWEQSANGEVDITREIVDGFKSGGSPYSFPNVSTHCGDGLFSSWPKPGAGIGGGWSVGLGSYIVKPLWFYPSGTQRVITSQYATADNDHFDISQFNSSAFSPTNPWSRWGLIFPVDIFEIGFSVKYEAKRSWTETVTFFLEADTQQVISDSRSSVETFSLNSSIISQPIDPGGGTPMPDNRLNSYFKTERGQQSFQFLLAYARAKLISRARCVEISFTLRWDIGINLSCRQNVHITDRRLPGGEATGKVIFYSLDASANGGLVANVTIGCTVGHGGSLSATDGQASYSDYADGYHSTEGGTVDIGDGTIVYQNFDDFEINDDGVNFFNMTPSRIIKSLRVIAGFDKQLETIATMEDAAANPLLYNTGSSFTPNTVATQPPQPAEALKNAYTKVALELVPVTGATFVSEFNVDVSKLCIPKTIDLEAPSNA